MGYYFFFHWLLLVYLLSFLFHVRDTLFPTTVSGRFFNEVADVLYVFPYGYQEGWECCKEWLEWVD